MFLFISITHITYFHVTYKLICHHRVIWPIPSFNFEWKRSVLIIRRRRAIWAWGIWWLRISKGTYTVSRIWLTWTRWIRTRGATRFRNLCIIIKGLRPNRILRKFWFFCYINRFNTWLVQKQLVFTFLCYHSRRFDTWSMHYIDLFQINCLLRTYINL